jgi:hypothetical protein
MSLARDRMFPLNAREIAVSRLSAQGDPALTLLAGGKAASE